MDQPKDIATFLERLEQPHDHYLSTFEGERSVMDSSLNQRMGPRDCNYFLRTEREADTTWKVLVDYSGPGCITRFFMAGEARGDGRLEIYLDDEPAPRIQTTLDRFFSGQEWPFLKPLVMDREDSSEGRVSYVPIPFSRRCIIRSDSESPNFYWQINALLYPPTTAVQSYTGDADARTSQALQEVISRWRQQPALPGAPAADHHSLPPGEESDIYLTGDAGHIKQWGIDTGALGREVLEQLWLRMYWDQQPQAAVEAPFLHFFCQGTKDRDYQSLLFSREGSRWMSHVRMPFTGGARITIENRSGQTIPVQTWVKATLEPHQEKLRFYCQYAEQELLYGTLYTMLDRRGSGRLIGMNQVTAQIGETRSVANFNQEGNEYIYVDHDHDPSWLGTGTEDHFNCAYYYRRGEVSTPTHGCLDLHCTSDQVYEGTTAATIIPDSRGLVSAYRFYVLDAVPYRQRIRLFQEAGCPKKGALGGINGKERLHYQWTLYGYEETATASSASSSAAAGQDLTI
ncbi:DUF2961 domain-containing protein [Paenibacillus sp. 1P07SE]|uniref:DUF2961 domain-containing protein n=1 Tax=Paenibacillus sp. 1P07SE TaxID=3132209 RepID=UPI0039A656BA